MYLLTGYSDDSKFTHLPPSQQLFPEANPREIVAVEEDNNKLAIVRIVSKYVFYYAEENLIYRRYIYSLC